MLHISGGFSGTRVGVTAGGRSPIRNDNPDAEPVARIRISYWCASGHETTAVFAQLPQAQIPVYWDCIRCGKKASSTQGLADGAGAGDLYKSHLDYVKERRTAEEGEELLSVALAKHRQSS
ncbi:RNA polymerase-binding protein RbpA [Paenarthrobacter sp. PH39-S1]|uniref:RNA polymerase-binding protein RbpA n=1 Tax=Paenarthrobacter sp. PH39-S1 TaxID=3046204 RepID=UPI0024BADDC9|nr:RNA polymerase-binding protein RbpA [Paenarthrobacter sp. PH39-S1]MDJ0357838.1 RNA polymerase-binding protein RbpA [Paenarthrobacter sp. PH39-S1]